MINSLPQQVMVSIVCNFYNHGKYVKQALESFLQQETNFRIEILAHDDASVDNTVAYIKEYQLQFPEIIKPIYQTDNQGSKGVNVWTTFQFPRAKGKYIALCDGDDFWTDPLKLQKQVDLLEGNPECHICFHNFNIVDETGAFKMVGYAAGYPSRLDLNDLVVGYYVHTCTKIFRASRLKVYDLSKVGYIDDNMLSVLILKNGGYAAKLEDNMAAYRLNHSGVWGMKGQYSRILQEITSFTQMLRLVKKEKKSYSLFLRIVGLHIQKASCELITSRRKQSFFTISKAMVLLLQLHKFNFWAGFRKKEYYSRMYSQMRSALGIYKKLLIKTRSLVTAEQDPA